MAKRKMGFTLLELLITIAIFILIVVVIFNIHLLSQKFYQQGETRAELLQNGRVILERMTREIRQAEEIATEFSDDETGATSTIEFQDGHDISFIHYLRYFRDDIAETIKREEVAYYFSISGDVASTSTYQTWDAEPPEGEILKKVSLESPQIIGEYVADLKIWGVEVIDISMTLEKNNQSINLETKVFGRNL